MSAAEELAKQTLRALEGMGDRMVNVIAELPVDSREEWRDRFKSEADRLSKRATTAASTTSSGKA